MPDFGGELWLLVVIESAIFIGFAASMFRPRSRRDWRVLGTYSAFVVALFTEMYGFPLTIYVLSGWLGPLFPTLVVTHADGHLLNVLIGWQGDPHLSPFHIASYALLVLGFGLLAWSWPVLLRAARSDSLATEGPYARIRHPQYVAFVLLMLGLLVQWTTLVTMVMFPILVLAYARLARSEEREVQEHFGPAWNSYAAATPAFLPRRGRPYAPGPDAG